MDSKFLNPKLPYEKPKLTKLVDGIIASEQKETQENWEKIDVICKKHIAKLEEIADVLGIDVHAFSKENDLKLAERMKEVAKANKKSELANVKIININGLCEIRNKLPQMYFENVNGIIREQGYIAGPYHENTHPMYSSENGADLSKFLFTKKEMAVMGTYLRFKGWGVEERGSSYVELNSLSGNISLMKIKRESERDPELKKFISSIGDKYDDKVIDLSTLYNHFLSYAKDNNTSDEKRSSLIENNIIRYHEDIKLYDKALTMLGRIFAKLSVISNERICYLQDLASDNKNDKIHFEEEFEDRSENGKLIYLEIYDFDDDFEFTEEDANKSKGLLWKKLDEVSR